MHPHAPSGARASGARASAFRHQRLEWPARFELALRPWQGRVLPLTLRPHGASGEIRTHDLRLTEAALCPLELQRRRSGSRTGTCVRRLQGPAGMPAIHPGTEPPPGADPGLLPYRGRVTAVCDGRAPAQAMAVASASRSSKGLRAYAGAGCPRCDSNAHCQRITLVPPAVGRRGRGAATRCRPGPSAVRRRSRSRARRRRCRARTRTLTPVAQNDVACPISRPGIECARRDLNPHALRHRCLKPARLPVSPPALGAPPGI